MTRNPDSNMSIQDKTMEAACKEDNNVFGGYRLGKEADI